MTEKETALSYFDSATFLLLGAVLHSWLGLLPVLGGAVVLCIRGVYRLYRA